MIRFPRHRIARLLRLPALLLILLAVLVNPVLAAVGDLHESSVSGTEHVLPTDTHDHAGGAGPHEEKLDLLHALMHAAHCCGHLTAILSTPFASHAPLFSHASPAALLPAPRSAPRTVFFRPPIAI